MPAMKTASRISASKRPPSRRSSRNQEHGDDDLGNRQHDAACSSQPFWNAE